MATSISLNGVSYSVPAVGEGNWGTSLSAYLVALSTGVLTKAGGSFTLTADTDLGANFGIKSIYFKSRGTTSTTGIVRLANTEIIGWRNALNSGDLALTVNSSNILTFNGTPVFTLALGAANTVLRMNSGGTAYEFATLSNSNIAAAAAIDVNKLAALTASRAVVGDGSGFLASSSTTTTQLQYLNAATGTTGTTSTNLVFSTSPTLVTPILGVASATTINKLTITAPASGSTLTIADGKTLTVSNILTLTGTDSSSVAFGAGGTVAYVANKLSAFAATTSSELAGVISDETGSGALVFGTAPTITSAVLVTPALGIPISGVLSNATGLPLTTGITGTLGLSNGGTGQTTANAALNALLPSQTSNSGKVLKTDGTDTSWIAVASTVTTTRGDLIKRGAAADERLAIGAASRVLTSDATDPSWTLLVNANIDAAAAISFSKLATLSSANILVGNGSNVATSVAVTGDVTITNAGVTAIASGVIVDGDVNASAAIAGSKITPSFGAQTIFTTTKVSIGAAASSVDDLTIDNNSSSPAMRIVDNNDRFIQISKVSGSNRTTFFDSNSSKNLLYLTEVGKLGSDITSWASSATQNIGFSVTTGEGEFVKFTSSRKYKYNIEDLSSAIDSSKLYDLRPVVFRWNSDNSSDFGFIAEEVALALPQAALYAVDKEGPVLDENGSLIPEAVRYQQLIALVVAEMKKLKARIDLLEALP